jgi:hypothetical protein
VRRNFKGDLLSTGATGISVGLLAVGIGEGTPILFPIAASIATAALVAKFAWSAERRKRNLPNSPRRRATDREREHDSVVV